jgi:hypothetical protein
MQSNLNRRQQPDKMHWNYLHYSLITDASVHARWQWHKTFFFFVTDVLDKYAKFVCPLPSLFNLVYNWKQGRDMPRYYTHHNDTQHKALICENQHNNGLKLCWALPFIYCYAECRFAECRSTRTWAYRMHLSIEQGTLKGKYHCTVGLLFDWFGISCMTTDYFHFYLQNRLIQARQTGGQLYSDTSPFSVPWLEPLALRANVRLG